MVQLHQILIGLVVIALVTTGLGIFIANGVATYDIENTDSTYDSDDLEMFNKMNELNATVGDFDSEGTTIDSDSKTDILGGIFTSAYQSGQIIKQGTSIIPTMINDGLGKMTFLGGMRGVFKVGLILMVIIAISIGLFFQFIIKSDRV